jgi:hypothetical protein
LSRRPPRGSGKRKRRPGVKHPARPTARRQRRRNAGDVPEPLNSPNSVATPAKTASEQVGKRHRLRPHANASDAPTESVILCTSEPRHITTPRTFQLSIQSDVLACAALCALGAALGVIIILGEMRYHMISPTQCLAYTLAALCAGVVLGLWIPRRVIRQRLARGPGKADESSASDLAQSRSLKFEFAASLAGALVLAFALTWVVLPGPAFRPPALADTTATVGSRPGRPGRYRRDRHDPTGGPPRLVPSGHSAGDPHRPTVGQHTARRVGGGNARCACQFDNGLGGPGTADRISGWRGRRPAPLRRGWNVIAVSDATPADAR